MSIFDKYFCKHEWVVISEVITKSPIDVLKSMNVNKLSNVFNPFKKDYILVLSCKKCGKINKTHKVLGKD